MIEFTVLLAYRVRCSEKKKVDELFKRFQETIESELKRPQLSGTMLRVERLDAPTSDKQNVDGGSNK